MTRQLDPKTANGEIGNSHQGILLKDISDLGREKPTRSNKLQDCRDIQGQFTLDPQRLDRQSYSSNDRSSQTTPLTLHPHPSYSALSTEYTFRQ